LVMALPMKTISTTAKNVVKARIAPIRFTVVLMTEYSGCVGLGLGGYKTLGLIPVALIFEKRFYQ